jgi:hypothetical protein
MSRLNEAIISELEEKAKLMVYLGHKGKPRERFPAHEDLRETIDSLKFFQAPKEVLSKYSSLYNILSVYLFNPDDIAERCLDLLLLPKEISRELGALVDEKAQKRKILGYILDESYLKVSEQKPTLDITPHDAFYLKLVQSLSRVDLGVARGYAELYNKLIIIKSRDKKIKKIVPISGVDNFGMVFEQAKK